MAPNLAHKGRFFCFMLYLLVHKRLILWLMAPPNRRHKVTILEGKVEMEFLIGLALCVGAYFFYRSHVASADRACVNNVAYRLLDKHRRGHTSTNSAYMSYEQVSKWLTEGQLAKDNKISLSTDEKIEISKAAGFASGEPMLNAVGLYRGSKEYWRTYQALMRLMVTD